MNPAPAPMAPARRRARILVTTVWSLVIGVGLAVMLAIPLLGR